jgi:hypothetical protein
MSHTRAPSPLRVNPAPFNPPEQYARELPIIAPAPTAPPAPGLITEVEHAAELALEVGEAVAEGLSPWTLASHAVALAARAARALRARR